MNLDCTLGQLSHLSCPTHVIDKKKSHEQCIDESMVFLKGGGTHRTVGADAISKVYTLSP